MDKISKNRAIQILIDNNIPISPKNATFSNINATVPVWWLEPNNAKFSRDLYLILNNDAEHALYVFFVPAGTFRNPDQVFRQRKENRSHIEIRENRSIFVDKKSGMSSQQCSNILRKFGELFTLLTPSKTSTANCGKSLKTRAHSSPMTR